MKSKKKKIIFLLLLIAILLPLRTFAIDLPNWLHVNVFAKGSFRSMMISVDRGVYEGLLKNIFIIFFQLANTEFLSGRIYVVLFKRVFLILGVFMLFKLTISLIGYVISPDSISDKEKGFSKLLGRVVTSLLFILVLMPMNNTQNNSDNVNKRIQENGILFGILGSVQSAILSDNVMGRLILGNGVTSVHGADKYDPDKKAVVEGEIGQSVAMTIFQAFYRINVNALTQTSDGTYECDGLAASGTTFQVPNEHDKDGDLVYYIPDFDKADYFVNITCGKDNTYLFNYDVLVSTLVGLVATVIIFLFTFDVSIRSIKLGILKLIAPIPALSYIDPKSSKDGAFANYTKTLTSTYLDLFLRLAIIYIVILLISAITNTDSELIGGINNVNPLGIVIMIISLLLFALQSPKFIMNALGIKSTGSGLGFGAALLGGALGGAISGGMTGGLAGMAKGLFGGAAASGKSQIGAQLGEKPKEGFLTSARNKGAQLGSGDDRAVGHSLLGYGAGKAANQLFHGINKGTDKAAKERMYDMENFARTASQDFTSDTSRLQGTRADGMKWSEYAGNLKTEATHRQQDVAKWTRLREEAIQNGGMADGYSLSDINTNLISSQDALTAVQSEQQQGLSEYSDYINHQAGDAKSKYEKGHKRYSAYGRQDDGFKRY